MKSRRFLLTLFVAGTALSGSLHAIAAPTSVSSSDIVSEKGKKDDPPRPKPTPGPRDGGDD